MIPGSASLRDARSGRGLVWQAEERDENGRTQRDYGLVGPHIVARVPAEEIVSPSD